MTQFLRTIAIDHRPEAIGLPADIIDLGRGGLSVVDEVNCHFYPTLDEKGTQSFMALKFPVADGPNFTFYEGIEIQRGIWDDTTGMWGEAQFGGYVRKLIGGGNAEHTMLCELVDYGWDMDTCPVTGWPFDETIGETPLDYPPGYSVLQWLAGSPFALGVVPKHLDIGSMDIDPIFDTIFFGQFRPGMMEDAQGYFGFVYLRSVITAIRNAVLVMQPEMQIGFWIRAVSNGVEIRPQFCFKHLNGSPGTIVATYATDADIAGGEFPIRQPSEHIRDLVGIGQRIIVKGVGKTGPLAADPLIYAIAENAEHIAKYPTPYFRVHGRAKIIIDQRLNKKEAGGSVLAITQLMANRLEKALWGARGTYSFWCYEPRMAGQWIWIRDVPEDLDGPYPIVRVEMEQSDGIASYHLICGWLPPDEADLIRGDTVETLLSYRGGRPGQSGSLLPGEPRGALTGPANVPTNLWQNMMQAHFNDVPVLTTKATTRIRPGGLATDRVNMQTHYDGFEQKREWLGPDNTGHPQHLTGGPITAIGLANRVAFSVPDPCYYDRVVFHDMTGAAVSGLTYQCKLNDITQTNPAQNAPLYCPRHSVLQIIVTAGTVPASGMTVLVTENGWVTNPY